MSWPLFNAFSSSLAFKLINFLKKPKKYCSGCNLPDERLFAGTYNAHDVLSVFGNAQKIFQKPYMRDFSLKFPGGL